MTSTGFSPASCCGLYLRIPESTEDSLWIDLLEKEYAVRRLASESWPPFTDLFLSVPSCPSNDRLFSETIRWVDSRFLFSSPSEKTIEIGPNLGEFSRLLPLLPGPMTRISIRIGETPETCEVLDQAGKAGLKRLSADLLFADHRKSKEEEEKALGDILAAGANHVALTESREGSLSESAWIERFDSLSLILEDGGLSRYEISHFAVPGEESSGILRIFHSGDVLGLGPGSLTARGPSTFRNVQFSAYRDQLAEEESPQVERLTLPPALHAAGRIELAIRLSRGFRLSEYLENLPPELAQTVNMTASRLVQEGFLADSGGSFTLLPSWLSIADSIASQLTAPLVRASEAPPKRFPSV